MKAVITSLYYVRGKPVTSYESYTRFSENIEASLSRQIEFLKRTGSEFELTLTISEKSS